MSCQPRQIINKIYKDYHPNRSTWRQTIVYNHKQQFDSEIKLQQQQKQLMYSIFTSSQSNCQNQKQSMQQKHSSPKQSETTQQQITAICQTLQDMIRTSQDQIKSQINKINLKKLDHLQTDRNSRQKFVLFNQFNNQINKEVEFALKHVFLNPSNQVSYAKLNRQFLQDQVNENQENFQLDQNCNYTKNQTMRKSSETKTKTQTQVCQNRKTYYLPDQQNSQKVFTNLSNSTKKIKFNQNTKECQRADQTIRNTKVHKSQKKYNKKGNDQNSLGYGKVYKQILSLYSTAKIIAMSKNQIKKLHPLVNKLRQK